MWQKTKWIPSAVIAIGLAWAGGPCRGGELKLKLVDGDDRAVVVEVVDRAWNGLLRTRALKVGQTISLKAKTIYKFHFARSVCAQVPAQSAIFAVLDEDCKRICRFNFEARLGVYPVLPLSDVLKPEGLVQLSEYLETNQVGIEWLIDAPGPTVPGAGGPERVPS